MEMHVSALHPVCGICSRRQCVSFAPFHGGAYHVPFGVTLSSIPRVDIWAVSKFCRYCVPVAIPDRISLKRLTLAATFHVLLLSWAEMLTSPLSLIFLSFFKSPRAFRLFREAFFPTAGVLGAPFMPPQLFRSRITSFFNYVLTCLCLARFHIL